MKHGVGDVFKVECMVVKKYRGYIVKFKNDPNDFEYQIPYEVIENAEKVEPEYEDGEWYMCKGWENEKAYPWLCCGKTFETIAFELDIKEMYWIGPKIERPEE